MTRTRFGVAMATAALGMAGVLGLAACGPAESLTALSSEALSPEGQVLTELGFETAGLPAEPSASGLADEPGPQVGAGPGGGAHGKHRIKAKAGLRKNVLHGETTVQHKDGVKVVDVQRGTVTAIDDKTVTVKSTDGFTLTWTLGDPIHVVDHRAAAKLSAVKVGGEVGIAGVKEDGTVTARLIVIPGKK